jgi:thymidylate synthase
MDEMVDRLDPTYINPGDAYKLRLKVWEEFLHDGKFSYTYNERIRTQLPIIIEELKKHPHSRQAIIEIHNNIYDIKNMGGGARIPCSMFYQFLMRDNSLDLFYTMRSCDFITHWTNDVWLGIRLLMYMSRQTGFSVGRFMHYITSLHAYRKDFPPNVF